MWPLVPLLMAILGTATSRTDPLGPSLRRTREELPLLLGGLSDLGNSNERRPQLMDVDRPSARRPDWLDLEPKPRLEELSQQEKLANMQELGEEQSLFDEDPPVEPELTHLTSFLTKLLEEPGSWEAPLVLVEEPPIWEDSAETSDPNELEDQPAVYKRSRYYRRYPWKRQNSRSRNTYDYDASRYLCTPTREDVFRLLVALHDARQGNKSRTVNFCNRRRPAGTVFTNIRFLGRRK